MINSTFDSLWNTLCLRAIGTDLTDVRRFQPVGGISQGARGSWVGESFLRLVFTEQERAYCKAQRDPGRHFAACFAVKEATVKALSGAATEERVAVPQIEALPDPETGHLIPRVASRRGERVPSLRGMRFFASVSYSGPFAIAFVVLAQEGGRA